MNDPVTEIPRTPASTPSLMLRLARLLWGGALTIFIAVCLFPASSRLTSTAGLLLFGIVWFGLIGLCWRHRLARFSLLAISLLTAIFLVLPARPLPSADTLRLDYLAGLQRYTGVRYHWGGESPTGIDCSGLIRRGLVDALFLRGLRTLDPGLVRQALDLWWHDTSAYALGHQEGGLTMHVLDTPSVDALDHTRVLPGDLAVTQDGVHVMAYLGNQRWIEADPTDGKVIQVTAPAKDNLWFQARMRVMRWSLLGR